ncbi:hypothetical protein CL648_02055 [bacterium]|nr:hypothetical protein [bacterium]|tara:strand:+ start:5990 stop:6400 length:411 start_codon:yes stop_codon:yes gene_type:complete
MYKILMGIIVGIFFVKVNVFGFATILHSISDGDDVVFNSNVEKMRVFVDGQPIGVMYGTMKYKLQRNGKDRRIEFRKDGYRTETLIVGTQLAITFWGNAIFSFGSITGSSTDSWSTKNSRQYTPNQFYVQMEKIKL